ncbi:IS3 family transposase [Pseudooceanicola sp. 216_PA32_1]|uniref:IS3 family transposase n=1 Tax=Pseudooceanicola pacificus TaxID=2676438 RepID=A0A844W1U0_9RHOB|nr:IS3 family transposase [Pseudooceanicola pacificus]
MQFSGRRAQEKRCSGTVDIPADLINSGGYAPCRLSFGRDESVSPRRACQLVGIDPRVYRYRSIQGGDGPLRQHLCELSFERPRFGYRRLHILLRREGWEVNWKELYRIYREERLAVHKRGGRKRALGTRAPMAIRQGPKQRRSLDFLSDALSCGRRFRVLCVIDDFSRECLATVVDTSISGVSRTIPLCLDPRPE